MSPASHYVLLLFSLSLSAQEEKVWQFRNLGKAFYENPATQVQAVDEFRKALDLAPASKREQLNYGLALLRGGKTKEGVEQLEKVQKAHPELPHTYFNLGITYKKEGDFERALPQFEKLVQLAPHEAVAHYNLGALYRQANRLTDAKAEFRKSIELNGNIAAPHFQLFNVHRALGETADMQRELAAFQALKKASEGAAIAEDMEWCDYAEIYDPIDAPAETLAPPAYTRIPLAQPADRVIAAGGNDLLVYSAKAATLYRGGKSTGPLIGVTDIRQIVAGDADNNGTMEFCVLTSKGAMLYPSKRMLATGDFTTAVWIDYDHDYDLDLLLFGPSPKLLRNQGTAGFVERTADFPFASGNAVSAIAVRMQPDSKSFDVAATYGANAPAVLYQDKLGGKYVAVNLAPLPALEAVADVNRDSYLDLVTAEGVYLNKLASQFEKSALAHSPDSYIEKQALFIRKPAANWLRVSLTGVKNLKLAQGAEVEMKAGALYQKQVYNGTPLLFDLGSRKQAETIRISWANGLVQNETNQLAGKAYLYKEAQRLSGSCPLIWTWNGTDFEFITDVLGIAPLGATSGDGTYFPVDHDEYIQISGDSLKPRSDGQYEVRVTEELSEVAYLDLLRLEAVDHPAAQEIYTNEKWKSAPFPEERLYGITKRVYPSRASDHKGRDVLPKVLHKDRAYPDAFERTVSGIAERHAIVLDFPKDSMDRPLLVLHGWVDWADGSTFLNAAQQDKTGLIPPYLQVRNAKGDWQTVIEDMGMPDGKPKTIAVDLKGKFLTASREIRIVTNLCVYWDEIFLADASATPQLSRTPLPAASADVRFRGFSANRVHPERKQPEEFFYENPSPYSLWNPTPGNYTRYGDVRELINAADDRFVVMGSGDEVRLVFDGSKLPPLPQGWRRDFLLKVDGWAKDRDANTAHSQTVEPLPFHSMSQYPFSTSEKFPDTVIHQYFLRYYNTRPALRLLRPLLGGGSH